MGKEPQHMSEQSSSNSRAVETQSIRVVQHIKVQIQGPGLNPSEKSLQESKIQIKKLDSNQRNQLMMKGKGLLGFITGISLKRSFIAETFFQ